MLIIRNLCKTYRSKGGVTAKALDHVSVDFPETGMVFLLGKSGSGKSTLLNVCGGLDTPDSGEIIVCGRSSNSFSGSDFDSYRNTFIGFIFQEYNILNEFSVEENIALALELQGKKKDKKKIEELLEQVDLKGFEKRKPNTLSGGQKQRIAIARALIKDPRIIMADEPSGALDSATGKQVFDTLKKLSKSRLVIVVSHDREFAEIYGDRIIELKDGKIISDHTKEKVEATQKSQNISLIDGHTLSIKKGAELSESELNEIKEFIAQTDGDVIVSNGQKDIQSFRIANRIDENDASERFTDTDPKKIVTRQYSKEEGKFVRSRLPISKAIKMGASSLKFKPVRLFFTILLSMTAFVLFGVFSTMMTYDGQAVLSGSFAQSYYDEVAIAKEYRIKNTYYENEVENSVDYYCYPTLLAPSDIDKIEKGLSGEGKDVLPVYALQGSVDNVSDNSSASELFRGSEQREIDGFAAAKEGGYYRKMIKGAYPETAKEVAISSWYFTLLKNSNVRDLGSDQNLQIKTYDDLLGKTLKVSFNGGIAYPVMVSGIFQADIPEEFAGWDGAEKPAWANDPQTLRQYQNYLSDIPAKIFLVSEEFYQTFVAETGYDPQTNEERLEFQWGNFFSIGLDSDEALYISSYKEYDPSNAQYSIGWFGEEKTKLSGAETVVSVDFLESVLKNAINGEGADSWAAYAEKYQERLAEYKLIEIEGKPYSHPAQSLLESEMNTPSLRTAIQYLHITEKELLPYIPDSNRIPEEQKTKWLEEVRSLAKEILEDILKAYPSLTEEIVLSNYEDAGLNVQPVGYYYSSDEYSNREGAYVSAENAKILRGERYTLQSTNYLPPEDAVYSKVFVRGEDRLGMFRNVFAMIDQVDENDGLFVLSNTLYNQIETISWIVEGMMQVFLYTGIALAVFASVLLFNFISGSISNKTREIGVLRAVGARGSDVFKIFFAESAIISGVCFVLALAVTAFVVSYLNTTLTSALGFAYSLFIFGAVPALMMVCVAVAVAVVGTLFPVVNISRKKPVDSMRAVVG